MITSEFAAAFTPEFLKYEVEHRRERLAASYGRRAPRRPRHSHRVSRRPERWAAHWVAHWATHVKQSLGRLVVGLRGRAPEPDRAADQVIGDVAGQRARLAALDTTRGGGVEDNPAGTRPDVRVGAGR